MWYEINNMHTLLSQTFVGHITTSPLQVPLEHHDLESVHAQSRAIRNGVTAEDCIANAHN